MKLLQDILYQARIQQVVGTTNIAIESLHLDSRQVGRFSLYVAVSGTKADGHDFIDAAIAQGAVAVVCEVLPQKPVQGITYVKVAKAREALGHIAANFYGHPSQELKLVGITGTNGKTTCATMLYRLYRLLGHKVGLLSTVENRIHHAVVPATHTTPDAIGLNKLLRDMVDGGCTYCFMEVSSHALHQHRVTGVLFTGAVFNNITHDHLDYHGTFDAYIAAKKILFDTLPRESFALINLDDKHGETMLQNCKAETRRSFALKSMADYKAKIIENHFHGLQLFMDGSDFYSPLVGRFNAYNILAVYATAMLLGGKKMDVLTALSEVKPVDGRFQYLRNAEHITAIVDYAHTPDALQNVLKTVEEIRTRNEAVITVVGCGGDRDKSKRPEMARIACKYSDRIILTSDNPRSEDPERIIEDMRSGVEPQDYRKVNAIVNRAEAIRMACSLAKSGDIILVAGKGHEKYQEIKGERFPFDDLAIVTESLKPLNI
jgi:UDP-N-acetylmuramoyl-L-alanyl-D-glutamate--2,6-diaminopimelate ligase